MTQLDYTPLYTDQDSGEARPLRLDSWQPGFGTEMKAHFNAALNLDPTVSIYHVAQVNAAKKLPPIEPMLPMADQQAIAEANEPEYQASRMPLEAQEEKIRENGLEGKLHADPSYTSEALDLIITGKKKELLDAEIMERGSHGILGFGAGFLAGAIDPVYWASSFAPAIPAARAGLMLANAGSAAGRAGVRALTGAASGFAGAAMVEPLVYSSQNILQADYDMAHSITNLFFGAGFGATLHSAGGAIADAWRGARGKRQPWEWVPPDDAESTALMRAHEEALYNAMREANPDALPRTLREQAHDEAATFDARARSHAYHERSTVKSFYDEWLPEYMSWRDFEPDGWRDLLPDSMRAMDGLGGLRGYEDLPSLNPDGVPIRQFMDNMAEWEARFPEMEDWQGIRAGIEAKQQEGGSNALFQFGGAKGMAVADADGGGRMDNLSVAGEMEAAGKDARTIKIATGWERGADGKWRYEIPDGKIKNFSLKSIKSHALGESKFSAALKDILDAPEIYKAYPDLAKIKVRIEDLDNALGMYDGENIFLNRDFLSDLVEEKNSRMSGKALAALERYNEIMDSPEGQKALEKFGNAEELYKGVYKSNWQNTHPGREAERLLKKYGKSWHVAKARLSENGFKTLLHEIQHAIQRREGFAIGGSPNNVAVLRAGLLSEGKSAKGMTTTDILNMPQDRRHDYYKRLAGEVEARNVSDRAGMSADERRRTPGLMTEEYFRDRQIVLRDGGVAASIEQAGRSDPELVRRFTEMPFVEADISKYFGEGKAISLEGGVNRGKLVAYAKKEFSPEKKFLNRDQGSEIIVTARSIRNAINHGLNEAKAFSVPFIPDIIESAVYLGESGRIAAYKSHIYANKLKINGVDYIVGFVAKEDANGNRFYDHELTEIITPDSLKHVLAPSPEGNNGIHDYRANQGLLINILRERLGVNDGSAKILFQSPNTSPPIPGHAGDLLGTNFSEKIRYEVRELDSILPSHDPMSGFAKNAGYPEKAQERPYHSDIGEQEKVLKNASLFKPALLLTDNPGANDGPPVITQNGIVLGGNSRTMSLGLVYARNPEKALAYRESLKNRAANFGIDAGAIDGMKKPVLVRVLSQNMGPEEMAKRSRLYNQSMTQALQGEAEAVSRARFVGGKSIAQLAEGLKDDRTVGEFLASADSADFARTLLDEGVLLQTEFSSLTTNSGMLNDKGKMLAQSVLRGLILPDAELLAKLPKKVLANLDAAIPGLARSRLRGDGFDLTGAFYDAMSLVATARKNGKPVASLFAQGALRNDDPLLADPVIQALAMLFDKAGPREIRMRLERYISEADMKGASQNALVPQIQTSPEAAFRKAFLEDIAFIGDERLPSFRPGERPLDAAIAWAVENGGKSPTVEKALAALEKKLKGKKTPETDKNILREHVRQLGQYSGPLGVERPKLHDAWKDPAVLEIPEPKMAGDKA